MTSMQRVAEQSCQNRLHWNPVSRFCSARPQGPLTVQRQPMSAVLQMSRKLDERPVLSELPDVRLRHYAGPRDIPVWLELRRRAFARQPLGVGDWEAADFEREFLHKSWWHPQAMWFAET